VNRETAAAVTALNSGLLIFFAVVLFGLLNDPGPPATAPLPWLAAPGAPGEPDEEVDPMVERGWTVYQGERCSSCHAIAGQGSPRFPLDGVASRLTPDELRLWVVDPQQMRPGVRKQPYDHLSEEEVDALVAFLRVLTEP
jgi:mono/diheme cytochrome c family protein